MIERTETAVEYDWGKGSPAEGMPEDNFSIRWTGVLETRGEHDAALHDRGRRRLPHLHRRRMRGRDWGNHRLTTRSAELNLEPDAPTPS
ncbi:MAG: hypothetical protein ACLUNS_00095 [Alistipes shahii]